MDKEIWSSSWASQSKCGEVPGEHFRWNGEGLQDEDIGIPNLAGSLLSCRISNATEAFIEFLGATDNVPGGPKNCRGMQTSASL